jgi:transposase
LEDVDASPPNAAAGRPDIRPGRNRRSRLSFRYDKTGRSSQAALLAPTCAVLHLAPDHFVRSLLALVEKVLGDELRSRCVLWGGFPYDPVAMFAVILYALMCGERASRRMEALCAYDVRFWFLSNGTSPDHSKFCRFRQRLDADGDLDRLMLLVVDKAIAQGLVKGKTVVADGTKIPTSGSQWRKYLDDTEASDAPVSSESGPPPGSVLSAPEPLPALQPLVVAELDSAPAQPPASKPKRGRKPKSKPAALKKPKKPVKPPSDPEARTMKTTHGEYIDGYNCQLAVDACSSIVLGALPTTDANDLNAMAPLLEATKKQSGIVPHRVVADTGYDSAPNHEAIEQAGATGYICPKDRKPFPFTPDENGVLRCLAGHAATHGTTHKDGVEYLTYRVSQCKGCPLAQACGQKEGARQREVNVRSEQHGHLTRQNKRRCARKAGKELLKCRGQTVERANARIKRDFRMRRFNHPGLRGARLELLIACIALNLQTILKASAPRFFAIMTRFLATKGPGQNPRQPLPSGQRRIATC